MDLLRKIETKLESIGRLDAWGITFVVASVAIGFFVSMLVNRLVTLSDLGFFLVMILSMPALWSLYNKTVATFFNRPKIHFLHIVEAVLFLWP